MAKKRGNNEGSITRRPDGRWMSQVTIGRDPATGKPQRATFYGKTRQEVADKLTKFPCQPGPGKAGSSHSQCRPGARVAVRLQYNGGVTVTCTPRSP